MIKHLSIENFRCLHHLKINDMQRVCLLSGKNNIGKSTILEALFLMMHHTFNDCFSKLNTIRGQSFSNLPVFLWEPLFYNFNIDNPISICINEGEPNQAILKFQKDPDYLPQISSGLPEDVLAQFKSSTLQTYSLLFQYLENGYEESGHFFSSANGILRQVSTGNPGNEINQMMPTQFMNSIIARSVESLIDGIGKLELADKKSVIVDILKELDPSIENIVTVSRQNVPHLYVQVNREWIPLQYAGEGLIKLLHICLAIMEGRDGLFLIDDIETGFHHSMYDILWKIINKLSIQSNCQIIACTHSYEMISALQDSACEDFAYYRIGRENSKIKAFRYDYPFLDSALRADMEIR